MVLAVGAEHLRAVIQQHGYWAVAVGVFLENLGVPVPAETMLVVAAGAAREGLLHLPWVLVAGVLGAIAGDNLGFEVGRLVGRARLTRQFPRLFTARRLESVNALFVRHGPLAVVVARFVPGLRVIAAMTAGTTDLRRGTFVMANAIGALAWAGWAVFLGYSGAAVGERILPVLHHFYRAAWVVAAAIAVALMAVLLVRRARRVR